MSRRVRRRLNDPLDQWTPATVAAAQTNRPRTYGFGTANPGVVYGNELNGSTVRDHPSQGGYDLQVWARGVLTRGQVGDYTASNSGTIRPDWAPYAAAREDWSRVQHLARFGRVVQTFKHTAVPPPQKTYADYGVWTLS